MVSKDTGCRRSRLRRLLSDDMADDDQTHLLLHLEGCAGCRAELERLAADPKWWHLASRYLESACLASSDDSENGIPPENRSPSVAKAYTSADKVVISLLKASSDPELLGYLDSYNVVEIAGRGGMGIVFKAFESRLNRFVAIKILAPHWASNATSRGRFAREAQAAAGVIHPNVVPIHAVGSLGDLPYLVMPFVSGRSLQDRIDACGPMPMMDVLRVGMQMADGLAAAHAQGLVHRDIKPGNVLLENNVERVLITDFGLARAVDDASLTIPGSIAGTPYYMSPEQARGEAIDYRSDLFSLGSVLYAMCTGRSPFRSRTTVGVLHRICYASHRDVREIENGVSDDLAGVINRLLAKEPAERFQSAEEVADVIAKLLAARQQPVRIKVNHSPDAPPSSLRREDYRDGSRQATTRHRILHLGWLPTWAKRCLAAASLVGAVAVVLVILLGIRVPNGSSLPNVSPERPGSDFQVAPGPAPVANSDVVDQRTTDTPGQEFTFSFRKSRFDPEIFVPTGVNSPYAASLIVPEHKGLRITIPAAQAADKPRLGFAPTLELHGDVEVTASYEILPTEPAQSEARCGANIEIVTIDTLASASLRRSCCSGEKALYSAAWKATGETLAGETSEVLCPAEGSGGKLRIARHGEFVLFLVAEDEGNDFRELHRIKFGTEPIGSVQFEAVAEKARGPVDIRWCDVALRATELRQVDFPLRFAP